MENSFNSNRILKAPVEEHITEIIMQLRQSGESLRAQYHMTKARLFPIDPQREPKKYRLVNSLALKLLNLAESVTECADEFQMFLDEGA